MFEGEREMRIHHLNCGTINVFGGVAIIGTGGLLTPARGVIHCLLAETNDGLLLVDTGFGTRDFTGPTRLNNWFITLSGSPRDVEETALAQVQRLGYAAEDVKHIVVTHFHFDHVGGLPDFPHAKVHIFDDEYEGVVRPRDMYERYVYRPEHWAHGPDWQIHRLEGDTWFGFESTPAVDLGSTQFFFTPLPGHTAGHCGVVLRTPDGWLYHCGDAYGYHKDVDPVNPQKPPHYGIWKLMVWANKAYRAMGKHSPRLRQLVRDHGDEVTLFCSHDPVDWEKFGP
jgi:glyoxylase-like metal-dependent hydrolase (beta-lactamase superfamily II)